jgi:hypothetical protein
MSKYFDCTENIKGILKITKYKVWSRRFLVLVLIVIMLFADIGTSLHSIKVSAEEGMVQTDARKEKDDNSNKNNKRKHVKELIDLQTENMTVYENDDGTKTAYIFNQPIRYKNKDGKLQKIDNQLVETEQTEETKETKEKYKYKNKANNIDLLLPENIMGEQPVKLKYGKYEIKLRPKNKEKVNDSNALIETNTANNNSTSIDDKTKTEEDVLSNGQPEINNEGEITSIIYASNFGKEISLRYAASNSGMKEDIILNSYEGINRFEFILNIPGLIPELLEDGKILLKDEKSDEVVGGIPQPFMYDSSEEFNFSQEVYYELEEAVDLGKDVYILNVIADQTFLESPDTIYPVTIDPTITLGSATNNFDNFVQSGYSNSNYYLDPELRVGYDDSTGVVRTYVKHPLPSIQNGVIIDASYKAYVYRDYGTSADIYLQRVTENWSSETITWNNQPSFKSTEYEAKKTIQSAGWYSWDVTHLASGWYADAYNNYGFVLRDSTENARYRAMRSSDYYDSTYKPRLVITYRDVPDAPTITKVAGNAANLSSGYVELEWDAISGVDGYMVAVFNGKEYEYFDVGRATTWSSKGEGIWPTKTEVENGRYALHHDEKVLNYQMTQEMCIKTLEEVGVVIIDTGFDWSPIMNLVKFQVGQKQQCLHYQIEPDHLNPALFQ